MIDSTTHTGSSGGRLFGKVYDTLGIWIWLIVFAFLFSLLNDRFLLFLNIRNILRQASPMGIMACGMTMVIITGGIDLSVGSVVSMTSAVLGVVFRESGNMGLAIAAGMAVGLGGGISNGLLVGRLALPPFIATFGTMSAGAGLAYAFTDTSIGGFPAWFEWLGNGMIRRMPIPFFMLLAVAAVFYLILTHRRLGRHLLALGGNEGAARMAGMNLPRLKLFVYTANGLLASFCGVILCARIRSSYPGIGQDIEMEVIAAAVIGGASMVGGQGRIFGAVGGAIFVCMIQNIFNLLGVYPFMQKVITGILIAVAVFANELRARRDLPPGASE
ncbi:MAG: ABC transporter permease [Planctomycetaceae bacterium]|nr:ABC transporter permease [Planctomycetaceae bacterium]